jgi:peptidyl-prolyl cis-trans isomerase-like protein 2
MGKWTDKLYITHGEWKSGEFRGGLSKERQQELRKDEYKRLPFDHCALSLKPFTIPVCTKSGVVFDLEEVERFIRLNSETDGSCKCPITGERLRLQDLLRLNMHKNPAGEYACPISGRVFADNSKVFVNIKNGHAYSAETVEQMCKSGIDFMTNQSCCQADFLYMVDPETSALSRNCAGRLTTLKSGAAVVPLERDFMDRSSRSTGKMAASFCSTSLAPVVNQEICNDVVQVPRPLRNAKVVIRTTHGECEAVLFAPQMPVTVYNFMIRARRGDYCNSMIHCITPDALITGLSQDSAVPVNVKERPHRTLSHSTPGMLGMCTDHDGTTSQFYITFIPASQYDRVNRIFGKLELGNRASQLTLEKLSKIESKPDGAPNEYAAILDVIIMFDPYSKGEEEALKRVTIVKHKDIKSNISVGKYLKI